MPDINSYFSPLFCLRNYPWKSLMFYFKTDLDLFILNSNFTNSWRVGSLCFYDFGFFFSPNKCCHGGKQSQTYLFLLMFRSLLKNPNCWRAALFFQLHISLYFSLSLDNSLILWRCEEEEKGIFVCMRFFSGEIS